MAGKIHSLASGCWQLGFGSIIDLADFSSRNGIGLHFINALLQLGTASKAGGRALRRALESTRGCAASWNSAFQA